MGFGRRSTRCQRASRWMRPWPWENLRSLFRWWMSGSSASDLSRYQGSSGHAAHLQLEESDTIRALDVDASVKTARTRNYWTVANIRAIKNRKAEGQERVIESSILVWHGLALSFFGARLEEDAATFGAKCCYSHSECRNLSRGRLPASHHIP